MYRFAEYARASLSGFGPFGWILWLIRPVASIINMIGDVDTLGNYLGPLGRFLDTGWGTFTCFVIGAIIIGSAILYKERSQPDSISVHKAANKVTIGWFLIVASAAGLITGIVLVVASTGAAPPSDGFRVSRQYHEVDVANITNALIELSSLLNGDAMALYTETEDFLRNWRVALEKEGSPAILMAELARIELRAHDVSRQFYAIEGKYEVYRDEVRYADDASNGEIGGPIGGAAKNLAQVLNGISGIPNQSSYALLQPWVSAIEQANHKAHERMQLAKARIQELKAKIATSTK